MISRNEIVKYINKYLNIYDFSDYGPNGLHIEGKEEIKTLAFAVSATKYSIEKAIEQKADMLIVHHGLFWSFHGAKTITGPFAKRVKPLIKNDINLLSYHLPLDAHLDIGNAASIAKQIDLIDLKPFGDHKGSPTGVSGKFKTKIKVKDLKAKLTTVLKHNIMLSTYDDSYELNSLGIITGGANSDWKLAKKDNLDAYLTGEMSEHDWHEAKESEIHFFAGGHNATEQFGVQELMKHLQEKFKNKNLNYFYIPEDNPA